MSNVGSGDLVAVMADASDERIEAVFAALVDRVVTDQPRAAVGRLRRWRDRLEVHAGKVLADQQAAGVGDRQLDRMMGLRETSAGERRKARQRAETLGRNETLADKVDTGELTAAQFDAICEADAKTDGKAANDPELLADITAGDAQGARRTANKWVAAQATNADLEEKRRMQRARREVRKGQTTDGLASLTISGDDESIQTMWRTIATAADRLYTADGGRDLPAGKHPRTSEHRLFDAACTFLTGEGADPTTSGATAPTAIRSLANHPPVIVVTADKVAGRCSKPAELIGVGPIADSRFEEVACNADFVGMLFDGDGEVLWHGRKHRRPTRAQLLALIARDQGCVQCGADAYTCHAHHLLPWSAPGEGPTDIDNLALVCQRCHRGIHEQQLTLYRERGTGRWETRSATPYETPPPRPVASSARSRLGAPSNPQNQSAGRALHP